MHILLKHWLGSIGIVETVRFCGLFHVSRFFLNCAILYTFESFVVFFGERFYEGLISILDSGKCIGPIV